MEANRFSRSESLFEVVPLEQSCDRMLARKYDHIGKAHLAEPLGVVQHLQLMSGKDLRGLLEVGLAVLPRFLECHRWAGFVSARWVADNSREVSDNKNCLVT